MEQMMKFPNLVRLTDEKVPSEYPTVLPPFMRENGTLNWMNHPIAVHYETSGGVTCFLSESTMEDGTKWMHLSVSERNRAPTYPMVMSMKNILLGPKTEALMVFPAEDDEVKLANCWHLWARKE